MAFVSKNGTVVTDEMLEELALQMEAGQIPGEPGEWLIKPPGRPRLSQEELVTVAFKIPQSQRAAADRIAKSRNQTRSEFMRELLAAAIASA